MGNARRRPNSRTAGTDTSAIKTAKLHPLIATMWPTPVAAFEELVGSHGGQRDERAQQRNPAPFRETGFPNIGLL